MNRQNLLNPVTMKNFRFIPALILVFASVYNAEARESSDPALNILVICAHPADAEYRMGGTAAKWIEYGHNVTFVSVTNGNAGHFEHPADELERIRRGEARRSAAVIGAGYVVMDINDAELMPTLENRLKIIRLIREHRADIVITHRTWNYHPDLRYTGQLVLDAAYMVTVPTIVPNIPHLERNPVFLFLSDVFTQPIAFSPDVCVDIDDVIDTKMQMLNEHKTLYYEWRPFNRGLLDQVPEAEEERKVWLYEKHRPTFSADPWREKLVEIYGRARGTRINHAECFQDTEYGTRLTKENMFYYFPFLD